MAFQTSANAMFSVKLVLMSTIVLSAALMLKLSVPVIMDFAVYELPSIYNGLVSWLQPPYLYLLINCIIITIVASSKLQSTKDEYESSPLRMQSTVDGVHPQHAAAMLGKRVQEEYSMETDGKGIGTEYSIVEYAYDRVVETGSSVEVQKRLDFDAYDRVEAQEGKKDEQSPFLVNSPDGGVEFVEDAMSNKENECVFGKSPWNAMGNEYLTADHSPSTVKPPVSARFIHRRSVKSSPEGVGKTTVLGVSKPKRNDTLESTWKTITDGRAMPLTRHLRKSDTWERGDGHGHLRRQEKAMSKAATFNNAGNKGNGSSPSPGGGWSGSGKARREASLTQDELNRRVEAFIKKFNNDMRLQRQESLNHYREMINRGSN